MEEVARKEPEVETIEPVEEIAPPVSAPTITEEAVDDFKEELKKIDHDKQKKKKDALRARVKAAQERARMAQQKKAQKKADILKEEENMLKDLEGEIQSANTAHPLSQRKSATPPPPPPSFAETIKHAVLENEEKKVENLPPPPPPPSYDMFDQLEVKPPKTQNNPVRVQSFFKPSDLPPPLPPMTMEPNAEEFEKIPSAPPIPMPPPMYQQPLMYNSAVQPHVAAPPPSFVQHEQHEISEAVNNADTTERMANEQAAILEQIEKEKAANDAAIAAAATEDFIDSDDPLSVPEPSQAAVSRPTEPARSASTASREYRSGNTINIGPNTKVTLRGEEQTRAAIKNGTAMIVQCLACRNWMQVANTASLMFCPSCSTISRVEPQNQITSIEEARLLMEHKRKKERKEEKERKLKEYKEMSWSQYVKSFFTTTETKSTSTSTSTTTSTSSYPDRVVTAEDYETEDEYVSAQTYGGETYDEYEAREQSTQRLIPVSTFETERMEPAMIAERRPLSSCWTGLTKTLAGAAGYPGNRSDEIDGIDSSNLLSVTRVGRN